MATLYFFEMTTWEYLDPHTANDALPNYLSTAKAVNAVRFACR